MTAIIPEGAPSFADRDIDPRLVVSTVRGGDRTAREP